MLISRQRSALASRARSLGAQRSLATAASLPVKDCASITPPYPRLLNTLDRVRHVLPRDRKLTLAEKILYSHLRNPEESLGGGGKVRGERYLKLRPDRVAMQVREGSHQRQGLALTRKRLMVRTRRRRWPCCSS